MNILHYFKGETIAENEGIWIMTLENPIPTHLSVANQIDLFYKDAVLSDCNNAMAEMYGFNNPQEVIGARLGDLLPSNPGNLEFLSAFITSNYNLIDAESKEIDKDGKVIYILNSLQGVFENGNLIAARGRQKLIHKHN